MNRKPQATTRTVTFRLPEDEVLAIDTFGNDVARRTPGLKVDRTAALRMLVLESLSRHGLATSPDAGAEK